MSSHFYTWEHFRLKSKNALPVSFGLSRKCVQNIRCAKIKVSPHIPKKGVESLAKDGSSPLDQNYPHKLLKFYNMENKKKLKINVPVFKRIYF